MKSSPSGARHDRAARAAGIVPRGYPASAYPDLLLPSFVIRPPMIVVYSGGCVLRRNLLGTNGLAICVFPNTC